MTPRATASLRQPPIEMTFNLRAILLCRMLVRVAGAVVLFSGLIGLLGWALHVETLKGLFSPGITMKANTAVCLLLSGLAMFLLMNEERASSRAHLAGRIIGVVLLLVGGLTLSEHRHDRIRDILRRQPVKSIALSGYGMADDIQRSAEAGFAAHLTKPVNAEQLRAAVNRILDQPIIGSV